MDRTVPTAHFPPCPPHKQETFTFFPVDKSWSVTKGGQWLARLHWLRPGEQHPGFLCTVAFVVCSQRQEKKNNFGRCCLNLDETKITGHPMSGYLSGNKMSADVDQLFLWVFDMSSIGSTRGLWADYCCLLFRHLAHLPPHLFAFCFLKPLSNVKWVQQKGNTRINTTKKCAKI